ARRSAHVPELLQRAQEPAGRGARDAGAAGDLAEGERRVLGVEGADDGEPAGEGLDEVVGRLRPVGHLRARGPGEFRQYGKRSRAMARPGPSPMQIASTATRPPRRRSAWAARPMMRPPEALSGCPIAMAPPWMLSFAGSSSVHSFRQARLCDANA